MAINPQSIKPPANPVARTTPRPTGASTGFKSATADLPRCHGGKDPVGSDSLQLSHLPPDPQLAAKEVNWYLQHYVGCTMLTPDGRNYRFSPPGEIWLPNAAALLTPDQVAQKLVLTILRDPVVRRMNFGVGFLIISATYYEDIAKAIEAGKIVVKSNPASGISRCTTAASARPRIELSPTISDMGLIVHECTHAIFDMLKLTTNVEQSEGFGYLSQALYGQLKYGPRPDTACRSTGRRTAGPRGRPSSMIRPARGHSENEGSG